MGERVYFIKSRHGSEAKGSVYASHREMVAGLFGSADGWREVNWLQYQLYRWGVWRG